MIAPVQTPENPGPIIGAGCRDIGEAATPGPYMRGALVGWLRPITMVVITTTIVDGIASEVPRPVSTSGIIQPMKAQAVAVKPEGQRAWKWNTLHATRDLDLKRDDVVVVKGLNYRVMGRWDYEDFGFRLFELVQDYQP